MLLFLIIRFNVMVYFNHSSFSSISEEFKGVGLLSESLLYFLKISHESLRDSLLGYDLKSESPFVSTNHFH